MANQHKIDGGVWTFDREPGREYRVTLTVDASKLRGLVRKARQRGGRTGVGYGAITVDVVPVQPLQPLQPPDQNSR